MDDPFVYDKAKYHYQGQYPADLPEDQAYVHTGMYLGWIVDHDLYSEIFFEETEELIGQFKQREIVATDIYKSWDGSLVDDMLNSEGNAFSRSYFDFDNGAFLHDYQTHLVQGLPTVYHVQETNENYAILTSFVDKRYDEWKRTGKISETSTSFPKYSM